MKKIYLWIVLGIIVISINVAKSLTSPKSQHSTYIYELIKNTNWPIEKKHGAFVIGVFGKKAILNDLQILAKKNKVGARDIQIKKLNSIENLSNCDLAYMPGLAEDEIEKINSISKSEGVLIVTQAPEMSETGSVNFISNKGTEANILKTVKNDRYSYNHKVVTKEKIKG